MASLSLRRLEKRFGAHAAVHELTLDVRDGELMCLLGPSGCGKTTTLRMIGGFETPDGGDIEIDGHSVVGLPPERRPTAMVFQRYNLWPHMTVEGNVAFGLRLRRMSRAQIETKVRDVLALVGLPDAGRKYPHQLSGGQQQRIAVARALVLEPKLLLLDEPFSNLDARLRVHMREEVKQLQREIGITTVFVTHDQEEALTIADRITVMRDGVAEQIDTPSRLYTNPGTLFVADFIGTMNVIPARVRRGEGALAAGPWRLPLGGVPWPDGSDVRLAVRPEDLVVDPEGPAAHVRRVMNLGHYLHVIVDVPELGTVRLFMDKDEAPAEGREIGLRITRGLAFADGGPVEVGEPLPLSADSRR
ncbi:MAG TPA: ABC transporter ATP-binding protein [Gaiellales bacterium]|nr:ABC transporter ATP-binding protein [Gaiellales bacterium]